MITVGTSFRFSFLSRNSNMRPVTASYYCLTIVVIGRSSHQGSSVKKGVLRNFAKFTGKHLCRVSFLMKLQAWGLEIAFKNFQEICSALANHIPSNFLKSVFHKFCLVHSWILCPICLRQCHVLNSKKYWLSSHDKPLFIKLSKSRVSLAVSLPSIWFSQFYQTVFFDPAYLIKERFQYRLKRFNRNSGLQAGSFLKRDSSTGIFMLNLRNF